MIQYNNNSFNMSNQQQKKSLLDPYRTIGGFISGKLSLSHSSPPALTAPTGCSFKVYSDSLAIKVASPCFPTAIVAAVSYNEYSYLRTEDKVVKMKYHHIVREWTVKGGQKRCDLLRFEGIIILNEGRRVILIDEATNEVIQQEYGFDISGIVHPLTYVNKVLLYNQQNLLLANVVSNKLLFSFQKFMKGNDDQKISTVQASPLVDIVGVGFDSGVISFLHLRKDQTVFSVKQKHAVSAIAFSSEESWMASGDEQGNVILWDLTSKRILYKFEECLKGIIDSLLFIPGLPVVTCGSSTANGIRQLRVNLEDNKILSLYRERLGSKQPLETAIIAGNNELVLSTASDTMFVSFHSQCNNYLLPRTLHSKLPYHLIARHFNVELFKGNSLEKTFPIHEYPVTAKISLSNKFYIVATKRKIIKLGGSSPIQWSVPNVHSIILFNEHSIFAATPDQIVVCDFNTNIILSRIEVTAQALTTNNSNTLLSFENREEKKIQVWDMFKISQGRVFPTEEHGSVFCLSFTSQNRFLVSSHQGKLIIWSIVDNELYKTFIMRGSDDVLWHSFTPDNQFMVSIFRGRKEANVWNNYIGRLTSTRDEEELQFEPQIRHLQEDYRKELINAPLRQELQINENVEDVLDSIPDAEDGVLDYSFKDITKWMPLVYYDEIRTRNAPNSAGEMPSMPFFLDFKNLTEEKKKIQEEIQREVREKRRNYSQQKDKHLKNESNNITLNQQSTPHQHIAAFQKLCSLSVAEVDYQLRLFLLNPANKPFLVKMIATVLSETTCRQNQELKNIILSRIINLLGADLLSSQVAGPCSDLLTVLQPMLKDLKQKVDRCVAISAKHLQ